MKRIGLIAGIFLFGIIFYLLSFSGNENLEVVNPGEVSISFSQNEETLESEKATACFESEGCDAEEAITQTNLQEEMKRMETVTVQEGVPITVETREAEPSAIQANILENDENSGSSMESKTVEDGSFELYGEGEKHVEIVAVWRKEEQRNKAEAVISRVMKVEVRE